MQMSEESRPEKPEKLQSKASNKDITPMLRGWDYEPGTINVRKVVGIDGAPKLQMRLDLGLLQMELSGRPDGERPFGCESLLEYHEQQLAKLQHQQGNEIGFHLTGNECQSLREEAVMYYHRYLSLFVLEDFPGVVRDTSRNLRVLDLCGKYADEEQDRLILEQYRPYIIMMHARARASILAANNQFTQALEAVNGGLEAIHDFFRRFGQEDVFSQSNEVRVLKRLARDLRRKVPVSPLERLQRRLDRAVKNEQYEEAARLRDKLRSLESTNDDNAKSVG